MLGRKLFSTGPVAAIVLALAIVGGCREATTAPSDPNSSAFASSMTVVSGNAQTGQIGAALSQLLTVKIVDAGGLPVQGAAVTFAARTGGGAVSPASGVSNAAGLVTATWTLGTTVGAQTAVAMLSNGFVSDSTSFSATATTGPAGVITLVSGNNQSAIVGSALALPLVVHVTDTFGNVSVGARVTWTAGNLSGSVNPPSDSTGADGNASATWTVGNTTATQTVTASVTGLPPIVFTATTSADTAHITMTATAGGTGQTAQVSSTLPTNLTVRVADRFGNPIVGDVITWNAAGTITGGGTVSAATSTTDATGSASTTWTLGSRAGAQTLRASEAAHGLVASFSATATVQFADVETGNFQTCGVASANNHVYCWGLNDAGQLGKGGAVNAAYPTVPVVTTGDTLNGPFLQARQVYGSRGYVCALTIARQMYCWGDVIGQSAATGVQTATFQNITDGSATITPSLLANGQEHQCILTLAGQGACTGFGLQGQTGAGVTPPASTAANTYVLTSTAGAPSYWSNMSAGQSFTCGMGRYNNSLASQIPYCWGFNGSGQLGNGNFANGVAPTAIAMPAGATAYDSGTVSAGGQHACAIEANTSTTPGAAWCWGSNGFGQLGTGTAVTGVERDSIPQKVAGGLAFVKIFAGQYHTCALSATGTAYCWGRNDFGQLGTPVSAAVPTPTAVGTGVAFRSLSLGELFTCGVTGVPNAVIGPSQNPGTIYCWGDNLFGQLGISLQASGGDSPTPTPTKVLGQP
jgi:alpha-tubulin suppressor-like RCC1 family protein